MDMITQLIQTARTLVGSGFMVPLVGVAALGVLAWLAGRD